jgi:hypothetical protein
MHTAQIDEHLANSGVRMGWQEIKPPNPTRANGAFDIRGLDDLQIDQRLRVKNAGDHEPLDLSIGDVARLRQDNPALKVEPGLIQTVWCVIGDGNDRAAIKHITLVQGFAGIW